MSVKVGVRVRPFNKRQEQLGARLCVEMQDTTTALIDSEGGKKHFNYDYSFWSHDGFGVDEEGYNYPVGDKYADQKKVYELIGSSVLVNAWQGYNCCLFAYGQTGSGKSYSMIGYGPNKGLIPIVCSHIFEKINGNQDGTRSFEVKVSMMEIYNQHVKDLLSKSKKNNDLKICEHKTLGVYVEGLEKHSVDSYDKIAKKIEEGSNNRSIAATLMNESSSRSHTIVSINFVQKIQVSMDQTSVKYSVIHLVDLAGSECVAKTGVSSKDRLRETAKINQSLTTLGRVIQTLADNCGKKDKLFVPYRDSKLTFILRNALGGNSMTAMICAISPADDNYEQTLSTLRYASRAKKIQNKAIVNESDVDKLIRQLRQQNQTLKKMLEEATRNKTAVNKEMIANFRQTKKMVDYAVLNDEQMQKEQESLLEGLQKEETEDSAYNESVNVISSVKQIDENVPYLTNIAEDQLLSNRIKYGCERLLVGNKQGVPKPDVVLTALGIQPRHALITYDGEKCELELLAEGAVNYTFVNGQAVSNKSKTELVHLDRIVFGTSCTFVLIFKDSASRDQKLTLKDIDYEFAMNEMQTSNFEGTKNSMMEEEAIRRKLVSEIEEDFLKNKRQKEEQMRSEIQIKQKQYQQQIRQLEQRQNKEALTLQEQLSTQKEESKRLLEEKARIREEVEKIMQESKLKEMKEEQEKKQLQSTKEALEQKQAQIQSLYQSLSQLQMETEEKSSRIKLQIKEQQEQVKKDLQIQTIICHNANILDQYKMGLAKRLKNANEVKDLLVKKQRIQLQKQLVELVPKIQRFNLMAKQMNKKVESGLSIQYKYLSEAQIIEVIKNNTYKAKLKILIHVLNREEGRAYYWEVPIFNNRFEHALECFDNYLKSRKKFDLNPNEDPYWDPQTFEIVAISCLTLQFVMFKVTFEGQMAIVSKGRKIGFASVLLYPSDKDGAQNWSIDGKGQDGKFKLVNPHEQVEKVIHFVIQISRIVFEEGELSQSDRFQFSYELLENIKRVTYSSEIISRKNLGRFKYRKVHTFKELSQNMVIHYLEKPITFTWETVVSVKNNDELTARSGVTESVDRSSFAKQTDQEEEKKIRDAVGVSHFEEVSPPRPIRTIKFSKSPPRTASTATNQVRSPRSSGVIYENTTVMKKVDEQYNQHKIEKQSQMKRKEASKSFNGSNSNNSKKKDENCVIY